MKRILCLVSMMDTGGAETFLMKLYRAVDRTKFQFDFCVNVDRECYYDEEIVSLGGMIYHIPSKTKNPIEFKRQLSGIVKQNRYEYVLRITSNSIGFWDLKIAKTAGARICVARSSNSSDGGGILALVLNILGRKAFGRYVDIRIAPSKMAAQYTFGRKNVALNRVYYLHNGINLEQYKYSESARRRIRTTLGIKDDEILIGHVGRFSEQKNHEFLLDVFYRAYLVDRRYKLVLVGDGALRGAIEKKVKQLDIAKCVMFLGVRKDIPDLLSAMDLFVFPSFYEGMPNTVIEAQATGLPCIISNTITSEVAITNCVTFLELDEIEKWVEAITSYEQTDREKTGSDLQKSHYDIRDVANEFINLIFGEET